MINRVAASGRIRRDGPRPARGRPSRASDSRGWPEHTGGPPHAAARSRASAAAPSATQSICMPQAPSCASRMARLTAWSSTPRTRTPRSSGRVSRSASCSAGRVPSRTVNQKVLPWPGMLSTPIVPPMSVDEALGRWPARARAAVLARGRAVRLRECLEQASLGVRRDADARVRDGDAQQRGVPGRLEQRRAHHHLAVRR